MLWIKFAQKGCFQSKTEKVNTAIKFHKFSQKEGIPVGNEKSEYHYWVLHIRISLCNKFQLKLVTLIFWTKFVQKRYFQSTTNKRNTTIEFCIFELVQIPNFSLNKQCWFSGPNLPKKIVSGLKQKKWRLPLNSAYSN